MLGELPVNRTKAYFAHRTHLQNFCKSYYCKRACLHCFINSDILVLDSEWHWIFDCPHFEEIRSSLPVFSSTLTNCRTTGWDFAMCADLVRLLKEVQIHDRVGVSLGSFIRQAMSLRESWMREVCARGRHCAAPDHWKRNLFVHPLSDENFPEEGAEGFDDGWAWFQVAGGISAF